MEELPLTCSYLLFHGAENFLPCLSIFHAFFHVYTSRRKKSPFTPNFYTFFFKVFGLHPNADITYQTNLANETFSTIVSIQPKDSSTRGGETREAVVQHLADEMLEKLPPDYNPHEVCATL